MHKVDHSHPHFDSVDLRQLAQDIKTWGKELGFDAIGISNIDLAHLSEDFQNWLAQGMHGEMDYMARHAQLRINPAQLVPDVVRIITARINYWPHAANAEETLADSSKAYVSRYALGRDYHKVLRARLQKLADKIQQTIGEFGYRAFVDSAPVMEVALAEKAGIGWRGKHTLLLHREAGSLFFLGELYCNLPLPCDEPIKEHCGTCTRCIDACPTGAIVAPYKVDARRCISYLTIELKTAIPEEFRSLIGNRVYGCDDCQLVCPWNRFAQTTQMDDFAVRHGLDQADLITLFSWSEHDFKERMAGSAIYRIGYERWLRNLAVGLGNAKTSSAVIAALQARANHTSALVREHVAWALNQHSTNREERLN